MKDPLAVLLAPVEDDLRHVSKYLAQLGQADGEYLHHVVQTLLERHGNPLTGAIALLVSRAISDCVPEEVHRFAAATQIVQVAGLAHRQIRRDDPLVPAEQPAVDLHLVVLAGDYLYSQAAFITAGLENLTVMRLLAEVIKEQCVGDSAHSNGALTDDGASRLHTLAAIGTGHLLGCDEQHLDDLAAFALALSRQARFAHGRPAAQRGEDSTPPSRGIPTLRERLTEIVDILGERLSRTEGAATASHSLHASKRTDPVPDSRNLRLGAGLRGEQAPAAPELAAQPPTMSEGAR